METYERWQKITRRWWFFLVVVLFSFIVPPYASKGFEWAQISNVIVHILENSLMFRWSGVYPIFQAAAILFVLGAVFLGKGFGKIFSIYTGLSYVLFAFGQNISITEEYGMAVLIVNVVLFSFVAVFWFWEASLGLNDFSALPRTIWKYWVMLPAVIAFWFPMDWNTLRPDFKIIYFITSGSSLTFCMMTPVFLAIMLVYYPRVNMVTLRVTSLVGLIIGFYNMLSNFVFVPNLWWNGVLHLPLIILSVYGLIFSCSDQIENFSKITF